MKCSEPNLAQGNQKKASKTSLHHCESNWNVFLLLYLVFTTLNKANFMMVTLVKMQILRITLIFIVIYNVKKMCYALKNKTIEHIFFCFGFVVSTLILG